MRKSSLTLSFGVLLLGVGASVVASSTFSCAGNKTVDVALEDPEGLRSKSKYVQLAVFPDQCPPDDQLANGIVTGAIKQQTIPVDGAFADIGDIKKAKYGFAALLRQDDCAVVGFGCTPVDLEKHVHITIQMAPVLPKPVGACDSSKGQVCNNGVCGAPLPEGGPGDTGTPDGDAADGDSGLSCTLTLVQGAGKEFQTNNANPTVSGPVAVATPSGFLAVYRESNATKSDAIRLPIDDNGAPGQRVLDSLTACPTSMASDGITAGWNSLADAGVMAVASPACGDAGDVSAVFTSFSADGKKTNSVTPSPLPYELKFQNVNGTAPAPNDFAFMLAALEKKPDFHPQIFSVDPTSLAATYGNPGVTDPATFMRVATASKIVAVAFDKAGDGGPGPVNFYVAAPNNSFITATYTSSTTAAVAAWEDKAILVVPTATGLEWVVRNNAGVDIKKGTLAKTGVTAVDAIALNGHFIVVAAGFKEISLFRFDITESGITAPASPIVLPSTALGSTSLDKFDGTMMSVAGARNRVMITWLNKAGPLGEGASPGGYVVLQCDG
ncbi:MAG: hypothetical protein HY898_25540 [Deltaproteobacteria bacterium]|nr:hypothetical protein [Deltaproteobacteria bacterium]